MHSIERYGIVALIFLVVTVVAVLMWDGGKGKKKPEALAGPAGGESEAPSKLDQADAAARRLELKADSQPGPLLRAAQPPARATSLQDAPQPLADQPASALELQGTSGATPASSTAGARPAPPEPTVGALAAPIQPATRAYVVQAGDTLSEIAQHELGSARRWNEIVAANPGLDPARLRSGRTIQLPASAGGTQPRTAAAPRGDATPAPQGPAERPAPVRTHRVERGENLWKIAERTLGDGKRWKEIADLNPGMKPDKLELGQVLKLPGAGASPAKGGAKAASKAGSTGADTRVAADASPRRATRGGKVK